MERGGIHELTMLVSSEEQTYKPKWEIMSMFTVDVPTPTRVSLLLIKITNVLPSKKRRLRSLDASIDISQRCLFCGHREEIVKKGAKKR